MNNSYFDYDIKESIGVLSVSKRGWSKELNIVSWNHLAPRYDIREWSDNHKRMGKGITFSMDEMEELKKLLSEKVSPKHELAE